MEKMAPNVEKLALRIGNTINQVSEIERVLRSGDGIKTYVKVKVNRVRAAQVADKLQMARKDINEALCILTQAVDLLEKDYEKPIYIPEGFYIRKKSK
jgi:uncharacterized alpha-E superfamily protein